MNRVFHARVTVVMLAVLVPGVTASAHHGIVNFDLNTDIEITGRVTQIAFINPHSWLYLDVTDDGGRVTAWRCELRGATVLRRSGWSPEMFAAGTLITITGAPDRFEPNTCYLGTAVFSDGTRVDRYGQIRAAEPPPVERQVRLANGVPNLAGDWAAEQRALTDPRGVNGAFLPLSVAQGLEPGAVPDGMQAFPGARGTDVSLASDPVDAFWNRASAMPLTEAGARAIDGFDGSSTDNPRLRCETTNILFDWTFEADVNRITQQEDRLVLTYGSMGLERTVHLNLTEHPSNVAPSRAGHSIGYWDGDVLVVDTVGFAPGILSADGRIPHSDAMHVVERFSLDADGRALRRTYVADDPLYLEEPYTGADTVYVADIPYQGLGCDDRSYKSSDETTAADGRSPPWLLIWMVGGLIGAFILWRLTLSGPDDGDARA